MEVRRQANISPCGDDDDERKKSPIKALRSSNSPSDERKRNEVGTSYNARSGVIF